MSAGANPTIFCQFDRPACINAFSFYVVLRFLCKEVVSLVFRAATIGNISVPKIVETMKQGLSG
jgi:hypothetical protein